MWLGLVIQSFPVSTLFSGVPFFFLVFVFLFFWYPFFVKVAISGMLGVGELRLSWGIKIWNVDGVLNPNSLIF